MFSKARIFWYGRSPVDCLVQFSIESSFFCHVSNNFTISEKLDSNGDWSRRNGNSTIRHFSDYLNIFSRRWPGQLKRHKSYRSFFFDEKSYRSFVKVSVFLCGNLKIFIWIQREKKRKLFRHLQGLLLSCIFFIVDRYSCQPWFYLTNIIFDLFCMSCPMA